MVRIVKWRSVAKGPSQLWYATLGSLLAFLTDDNAGVDGG